MPWGYGYISHIYIYETERETGGGDSLLLENLIMVTLYLNEESQKRNYSLKDVIDQT